MGKTILACALAALLAGCGAGGNLLDTVAGNGLPGHELAAAMGFDGYVFSGNKTEQVKQIGNAVSVRTAAALCLPILRRLMRSGA